MYQSVPYIDSYLNLQSSYDNQLMFNMPIKVSVIKFQRNWINQSNEITSGEDAFGWDMPDNSAFWDTEPETQSTLSMLIDRKLVPPRSGSLLVEG